MSDPARNQTDKELARMEKYLAGIFAEAEKKLISDAKRFLDKFNEEDSKMKAAVDSGDLDEDDYNDWRVDRLRRGDELHKIITKVKKEMANCNKTAIDYINGKVPYIFAINYNSIAEVIANSPVNGYTFELIDANTVRNIVTADDVFLPPPQKELDVTKDMLWNAKQVNAQLLQGILLGESVDEIADRMANVCNSNASAARRNARTMITAAENSGRQSGMNKAEKDGIVFKKKWIGFDDGRERDSHIALNGTEIPNGEMFHTINGDYLEFPGDWRANGYEVYNCRCSLGSVYKGFDKKKLQNAIKNQKNTIKNQKGFGAKPGGDDDETIKYTGKSINGVPGTKKVESPKKKDSKFKKLMRSLENHHIDYLPMTYFDVQPSEDQIIKSLQGGDMTKFGACASLSLAYIGQTLGINVLDYRGGNSHMFFGKRENFHAISKLDGMASIYKEAKSSKEQAINLLSECEYGKIYMLAIADHASIVRKNEKGEMEYLELQNASEDKNGWQKLTGPKLMKRFELSNKKVRREKLEYNFLLNVTDSKFGDDFKYMLGYINTSENKQMKGAKGGEK